MRRARMPTTPQEAGILSVEGCTRRMAGEEQGLSPRPEGLAGAGVWLKSRAKRTQEYFTIGD